MIRKRRELLHNIQDYNSKIGALVRLFLWRIYSLRSNQEWMVVHSFKQCFSTIGTTSQGSFICLVKQWTARQRTLSPKNRKETMRPKVNSDRMNGPRKSFLFLYSLWEPSWTSSDCWFNHRSTVGTWAARKKEARMLIITCKHTAFWELISEPERNFHIIILMVHRLRESLRTQQIHMHMIMRKLYPWVLKH